MKLLLAYAALVGLPLAGLAVVLHAGGGLRAPADIGGEWRLPPVGGRPGAGFTLSQSGSHVRLTLGGTEYRGVFRGGLIVARSAADVEPRACGRLRATIDTAATPMRMTVAPSGCGPGLSALRTEGAR